MPELVSFTGIEALVVVSIWGLKDRLVGLNAMLGPVPVPVSGTVCGLPRALSVNVSAPVRAPSAVGVNVTLIVQFPMLAVLRDSKDKCSSERNRRKRRSS